MLDENQEDKLDYRVKEYRVIHTWMRTKRTSWFYPGCYRGFIYYCT